MSKQTEARVRSQNGVRGVFFVAPNIPRNIFARLPFPPQSLTEEMEPLTLDQTLWITRELAKAYEQAATQMTQGPGGMMAGFDQARGTVLAATNGVSEQQYNDACKYWENDPQFQQ